MIKNDMLKGPVVRSLLMFALPLMISNIFQQLYNTVDTIVIGNELGDLALAALGASMAVFQLLVGFALGFGNGFGIVVARYFGAGDEDKIKESVANAMIIGVGVIILVMLASVFLLRPLLTWLRTPEEIFEMAYNYISIITLFAGVMFFYNFLAGLLRAIGNSVMPLVFLILSSLLNIVLDILFVVYMGYGIEGAAVATVIAQSTSVVVVAVYIMRKAPIIVPKPVHFKVRPKLMKDLAGQGLSMALMSSFVIVGTVILQYAINDMGYLIIAGHTVARRIHSLFLLPIVAVVLAISTFVSQNKGADQGARIIRAVKYQFILCIGWGAITFLLATLFSSSMIEGFSGTNEELVIRTGSNYLRFNTFFYGLVGVLLTTRFALQGLGEKVKPLISSIIELVMKFIFVIMVIPKIGYTGVIISEPIIWIVMATQLLIVYYRHPYIRKYRKRKTYLISKESEV